VSVGWVREGGLGEWVGESEGVSVSEWGSECRVSEWVSEWMGA
jgi:hypothetical protein